MVEILALGGHKRSAISGYLDAFVIESTTLLEQGITRMFDEEPDRLSLPPERLARLVRTSMYGLICELALARDADAMQQVDQTYQDLRTTFSALVS